MDIFDLFSTWQNATPSSEYVTIKGMTYYFQSLKFVQDKISNMSTVSDVVPYLLCGGYKAVLSAYTGNNVPITVTGNRW